MPAACGVLQAQRHTEAARLLVDTALQLAQQRAPPLQIKKLYVLAALEIEAFKKKAMAGAGSNGATAAATMLGTAGAVTTAGPPGTTRAAGRGATTKMPAQTATAAQTLAGRNISQAFHVKEYSLCNMHHEVAYAQIRRALLLGTGSKLGCDCCFQHTCILQV